MRYYIADFHSTRTKIVSPKQSTGYIVGKVSSMLSDNPGSVGKIVI